MRIILRKYDPGFYASIRYDDGRCVGTFIVRVHSMSMEGAWKALLAYNHTSYMESLIAFVFDGLPETIDSFPGLYR